MCKNCSHRGGPFPIFFPIPQRELFSHLWIRTQRLLHNANFPHKRIPNMIQITSFISSFIQFIRQKGIPAHPCLSRQKNTHDRFDSEMKRMEDEMNKFRSELINRESSSFRKTGSRFGNIR